MGKVSTLPVASPLADANEVRVVQSGVSKKATVGQIATAVASIDTTTPLAAVVTLNNADLLPVVQGGVSKKATVGQMKAALNTSLKTYKARIAQSGSGVPTVQKLIKDDFAAAGLSVSFQRIGIGEYSVTITSSISGVTLDGNNDFWFSINNNGLLSQINFDLISNGSSGGFNHTKLLFSTYNINGGVASIADNQLSDYSYIEINYIF